MFPETDESLHMFQLVGSRSYPTAPEALPSREQELPIIIIDESLAAPCEDGSNFREIIGDSTSLTARGMILSAARSLRRRHL